MEKISFVIPCYGSEKTIEHVTKEINVDAVCTIASDLRNVVASFVARQMGLPANSEYCIKVSSNKSIKDNIPDIIDYISNIDLNRERIISDSSSRCGFYILKSDNINKIKDIMEASK